MGFKKDKNAKSFQSDVDFEAMNKYIAEQADCENGETIKGVIVGYYDLGTQKQGDFQMLWEDVEKSKFKDDLLKSLEGAIEGEESITAELDLDPDDESYEGYLKYNPETGSYVKVVDRYFNNGKVYEDVEIFGRPSKDCKSFTYVVEFPDIMLNLDQFNSSIAEEDQQEKPLRLVFGSESLDYIDGKATSSRLPAWMLKESKDPITGNWGFPSTSALHKMADSAGLLNSEGKFKKDDVYDLGGESFQFKVTIKLSDCGKYLNKKIAFAAKLAKGSSPIELDEDQLFTIFFNDEDNDLQRVKEIDFRTLTLIKQASDYKGSILESQINSLNSNSSNTKPKDSDDDEDVEYNQEVVSETKDSPSEDDFDEDIPF